MGPKLIKRTCRRDQPLPLPNLPSNYFRSRNLSRYRALVSIDRLWPRNIQTRFMSGCEPGTRTSPEQMWEHRENRIRREGPFYIYFITIFLSIINSPPSVVNSPSKGRLLHFRRSYPLLILDRPLLLALPAPLFQAGTYFGRPLWKLVEIRQIFPRFVDSISFIIDRKNSCIEYTPCR